MKKIVWAIQVLKKTVVCDQRFDILCGSHLQSEVIVIQKTRWAIWLVKVAQQGFWILNWLRLSLDSEAACTSWNFSLKFVCNGTANKFHKVVLHGETLVFVTTEIVASIAEVESGSTFRETCLATEVQNVSRNRPWYTVEPLLKNLSQRRLHTSFS